ncbi:MAG: glycosyltransferase [Flavobacteriaceae bacterium]|nr:glycosyltransferase [Flavobacteriaceae bacterium]MDG2314708.1 glycosyltransferase [Flavobacteriaceae bacterium]
MKNSLAVLLTCHNRKKKTLACLDSLHDLLIPKSFERFDIYLVDDSSSDGTAHAVAEQFPDITLVQGNGELFWNQGMRLAWNTAISVKGYDFYMWLNDDVFLQKEALLELYESYQEIMKSCNKESLVTGAFKKNNHTEDFSYGGRSDWGNIVPNGEVQQCKYINGNTVLISKNVFNRLGNLSSDYTHGMGDFDYGLRALQAGFKNVTTKRYIGVCTLNENSKWHDASLPLKKRLDLFYSPLGLNYKEYIVFRKKFWKKKWVLFSIKAYLRVLFPYFYNKINNL